MRADMVNRGPYIYYTSNTVRTVRYRVPSNNTMRTRIELKVLHVVFHHAIQHTNDHTGWFLIFLFGMVGHVCMAMHCECVISSI